MANISQVNNIILNKYLKASRLVEPPQNSQHADLCLFPVAALPGDFCLLMQTLVSGALVWLRLLALTFSFKPLSFINHTFPESKRIFLERENCSGTEGVLYTNQTCPDDK